ncbi:MAG TPA: DUF4232 domain-containing protein [Streptosporangiaceae bacterium]|nr:DUF4232 domain-containing protein [Streptosporangiaceae bacterium]
MKLSTASAGRIATIALACSAVALPVAAVALPTATAEPTATAQPTADHARHDEQAARAVHRCTTFSTTTWLGLGNGGGTLGTIFYPIEFSNTGKQTCTLFGYPGVSAISGSGHQIGQPAIASGKKQVIMLKPGGTAHVVLGIVEAGNIAGCKMRPGAFLKIFAPGQKAAATIPNFTFTACANKSVLRVDAVHAGTGIPGAVSS